MEAAARANKAIAVSDYDTAIKELTVALKTSPTSPDYLIKRSTAYQRQKDKDYASSLRDAENGVVQAQKRAKRELIVQAQLRRGIALFGLERFGDAKLCFEIVRRMHEKESTLPLWEKKTADKLAALPEGDDKAMLTIKETPEPVEEKVKEIESREPSKAASSNGNSTTVSTSVPTPPAPQQTPKDRIRHEWYQSPTTVYFTLFVKGAPKDKTTVDITPTSLNISFPLADDSSSYELTFDPLYAAIDPSTSVTKILGTKIEVSLAKSIPGQKWHAMENPDPTPTSTTSNSESTPAAAPSTKPTPAPMADHGPAYPTSSRTGPKNWDAMFSDSNKDNKENEEEEVEGDPANHFFKKLFKDSSPEVQRAMMKSYTESNGTALSTDWSEVSKGKVETSPPDGMEARKW